MTKTDLVLTVTILGLSRLRQDLLNGTVQVDGYPTMDLARTCEELIDHATRKQWEALDN